MAPPKHLGFKIGDILPFASDPYTINMNADKVEASFLKTTLKSKLQASLPKKYPGRGGDGVRVPFSIMFLADSPGGSHLYAGVDDDRMCFSASLLKPAVMFAANELRAAANRVAETITVPSGTSPSDQQDLFLEAIGKAFNKGLAAGPWAKTLDKLTPGTPTYEEIFVFDPSASPMVNFRPPFALAMTAMTTQSDDAAATKIIDLLGFTYINAALANGGFFGKVGAAVRGIWISGDYDLKELRPIKTMNDGMGKLVMDTSTMTRMFALIQQGSLVDSDSSAGMASLLKAAVTTKPLPWITHADDPKDDTPVTAPFTLLMTKLGVDHLGRPGALRDNVFSECSLLQWDHSDFKTIDKLREKHLSDKLIVCWQNYQEERIRSFDPIRQIVTRTVLEFLV